MLTYVCVLSILFSLLSCSSEVSNENEKFRTCNELEISIIDTIKLPLDSVTPSATTMSQKIEEYYTFLSYGKPKRILFYDITTQIPVRSLYVGDLMDNVSGYLIHNLDSIFLFSYATNSIKLINSQEEVLNHWKLPPFRRGYLNSPRILTGRPMLIKDGKIYCGGIGTGKPPEDQKIITEIDMITKKVSTFMEYPAFYHQSNWGGAYFRYTYMTKDFNSDFLISYPASHFIYKTPDFKKMDSFYGGSGEIKKISSLKGKSIKEKRLKHFQSNYSYRSIIPDPYRKVYYRVYEKPIQYKENPPWYKPCGVIVLDKDLEYIGEFDLEFENISPSWHYTTFVSPLGLCVQTKPDIEEKHLSFVVLSFKNN